MWKD